MAESQTARPPIIDSPAERGQGAAGSTLCEAPRPAPAGHRVRLAARASPPPRLASAHRAGNRAAGPRTRGLGGPGGRRARRFTPARLTDSCPHREEPPSPDRSSSLPGRRLRDGDRWGTLRHATRAGPPVIPADSSVPWRGDLYPAACRVRAEVNRQRRSGVNRRTLRSPGPLRRSDGPRRAVPSAVGGSEAKRRGGVAQRRRTRARRPQGAAVHTGDASGGALGLAGGGVL